MSDVVGGAFIAFLAAVIGGLIQARANSSLAMRKFQQEAKWSLYTNYFTTIAELSFAEPGSERYRAALATMAQLRGRIGIIASPPVIRAVADTFRFEDLSSSDAKKAMAATLRAMRSDCGQKVGDLAHDDLSALMFRSARSRAD